MLSAGVHEFGHAAACRYGGATPGGMGFGLYLVLPAFYTDVTDSYRLDRRGRLWVDLGGLYFNAVLARPRRSVCAAYRRDALLLLVGTQVLQMLRQLSPVIRADGYHILADLTGVPDLFAHLKPTVASLGRATGATGRARLKRWARVVVIAWVLLIVPSLVFALASGAVALPRLVATAWDSLGVRATLSRRPPGTGTSARSCFGLKMLAVALPVAGTILMLGRVATARPRPVGEGGRRSSSARADRGRVGAIVLVLGWFWWPRDQYQPIGPTSVAPCSTSPAPSGPPRSGLRCRSRAPGSDRRRAVRVRYLRCPGRRRVPRSWSSVGRRRARRRCCPSQLGPVPRPGNPWPFPFPRPAGRAAGNARALSINTADGTAIYDVAYSTVWVTGQDVHVRNDAIALADCTRCTSVAVAFQAVFLLGQSDVRVAPVNTSQALNYHCMQCRTTAVAVQLVVSLTELPDAATKARLDQVLKQSDQLTADLPEAERRGDRGPAQGGRGGHPADARGGRPSRW